MVSQQRNHDADALVTGKELHATVQKGEYNEYWLVNALIKEFMEMDLSWPSLILAPKERLLKAPFSDVSPWLVVAAPLSAWH